MTTLAIQSTGMATNVGLNARTTCAAIRAHIARFEEVAFRDARGVPILAAPAADAVGGRQGHHRLTPLLCLALQDCIDSSGQQAAEVLRTVPCLIVIDCLDRRPDLPGDIATTLLAELRSAFGTDLHPLTQVATVGATGLVEAMTVVAARLSAEMPSCLVVAVDSLINREMLAALERQRRLKTDDNSDGIIPGEAATALWFCRADSNRPMLAHVLGIGVADEPSSLDSSQANRGIGLAQAMSRALADANIPLHKVDFRVGSMTGERWGFVEASTALARIQRIHKDDFALWLPAEQLGDNGAALSACMLSVTAVGVAKGYAPGPVAILYLSSLKEKRAACVLSAVGRCSHGQ